MGNGRLERIDIAKGIGIILVVFAHTLVPQLRESNAGAGFLWIFIYNFHMPLFFFLSGRLFEKALPHYTNRAKFITRKLKLLMLPYLTFSVFAYAFINCTLKIDKLAGVLKGGGYSAAIIKDAVFQILTYSGHIDKHLWFVFSLFLVFIINILLPKIMKSKAILPILALLYLSKAYMRYFGILDYTADNLFFFSLARYLYSEKQFKLKYNILTAVIFIITNCIYSIFYINGMPDNGLLKDVLYLVRLASAVSGIAVICRISEYLQDKKISRPFKELGLYSYDIYLIHAPFLVSGSMGILLAYSPLPAPVCCAAALIAGIAVPYVVSRFIIRKIPVLSVLVLGKSFKKAKNTSEINLTKNI